MRAVGMLQYGKGEKYAPGGSRMRAFHFPTCETAPYEMRGRLRRQEPELLKKVKKGKKSKKVNKVKKV